jgi:hypothetical protein
VDDVTVVDDMGALVMIGRATATQREQPGSTEKALQPVVVEAHAQAMADEPRGDRVEHLAQREAAARGHCHDRLFAIGGALWRPRPERRTLDLDQLAPSRIVPADYLVEELPVGVEVGKITRSSQQQLIAKRPLEMPVRALDGAVLMREAGVVARRCHSIMRAGRA